MSDAPNPFNCSSPGNLFTGYGPTRKRIVKGVKNGNSYAILGGRRCGKTSLLLELDKDLQQAASDTHRLLPRILDMQAVTPRTAGEFFCCVYEMATQDSGAPDAKPANYQGS